MRHVSLALLGALAFAWYLHGAAQSSEVVDWGFEGGGAGWTASGAAFDTSAPAHDGVGAGRLLATSAAMRLESSYWLFQTVPGARVTAALWVAGAPTDLSSISVDLQFLGAGGNNLLAHGPVLAPIGPYSLVELTRTVPADGAFARIVVQAAPRRLPAELHIDSVVLTEVRPDATPAATLTPTVSGTATGSPSAAPTASATSTPTKTPTKTPTTSATPTKTATATPTATAAAAPAVFATLTNGDFEDPRALYGWSAQGGTADLGNVAISTSQGARLASSTVATKWLSQTVTMAPGTWYQASAQLGARSLDDEVWLRLAWYESPEGSGSQLEVVDSPTLAELGGMVALGPTRAPANAHSVRVRLMLRPASAAPTLLVADDVTLLSVPAPPPTTTPTVSPTALSSATAAPPLAAVRTTSPTQTPAVGGRVNLGTGAALGGGSGAAVASTTNAAGPPTRSDDIAGAIVRISELLPDPIEGGLDSQYEWVEIANFGTAPATLEGLAMRDNAADLVLPAITLVPGGVLVVAASRADTGSAEFAHRLPGAINNGLGNGGDRLALITPEGAVVDAVSWGSDRTYGAGMSNVPAPGPGRSLLRRFTDDGSLVSVERSDTPTPGRVDDSLVRVGETDPSTHLAVARNGIDERAWIVLLAVGAVSAGWTVVLRLRAARVASPDREGWPVAPSLQQKSVPPESPTPPEAPTTQETSRSSAILSP